MELDDIFMIESTQDSDFSDGLLFTLPIFKFISVLLLNCNSFISWSMDAFFDNCVGAMPDLLTKKVSV